MNKLYLFVFIIFVSCKFNKSPIVEEINFDFVNSNGQPSLVSNGNNLSLSWISQSSNNDAILNFSQYKDGLWMKPKLITSGDNWFVNWADFPAHSINNDLVLSSHLKKSGKGTYDYDIIMNLKKINGETIKSNFILNNDGVKAEHGFVSITNDESEGFFVTWLDGRNMSINNLNSNHNPMTIRFAQITKEGEIINDTELDSMTCECCQTSVTNTDKGPVVVYRDRNKSEIRDIYITRSILGDWDNPKPVNNDNWKINGCPVNGPKVVSSLSNLAVAWFTISNNQPVVNIAFSNDYGTTFNAPIKLNDFDPIGRVDVDFLNKKEVIVSYIENDQNGSFLRIKKVNIDGSSSKYITVGKIDGKRSSGVPQLEVIGNEIFIVWTISKNENETTLKSVKINQKNIF